MTGRLMGEPGEGFGDPRPGSAFGAGLPPFFLPLFLPLSDLSAVNAESSDSSTGLAETSRARTAAPQSNRRARLEPAM